MAQVKFICITLLLICGMVFLERTSKAIETKANVSSLRNFDIQVLELVIRRQVSATDLPGIYRAMDDIVVALRILWPDAKLEPFGSLFTGLGTSNSDLDCFIKLPPSIQRNKSALVESAAEALKQYPHLFAPIAVKNTANVPIVRTVHVPTFRDVDINFNGVSNTRLINYYLHLDDRAFKLAVILSYWMELQKVDGKSVPNYTTTLLVVFYLHQKRIVPSVAELQRNAQPDMRKQWNHAFEKKAYSPNPDYKLFDLLVGFFEYYANFAYDKYVISTFAGYPIERDQFVYHKSLPEEFELYKRNVGNNITHPIIVSKDVSIVIQSPFIHNQNAASKTRSEVIQNTIEAFKKANNIYQQNQNSDDYLISILKKL